eukprot:139924-Pyramimonas_sp.AAC.1
MLIAAEELQLLEAHALATAGGGHALAAAAPAGPEQARRRARRSTDTVSHQSHLHYRSRERR